MKYQVKKLESLEDVKLDNLIKFSKVNQDDEYLVMLKAFELFFNMPKDVVRQLQYKEAEIILANVEEVINSVPKDRVTFEMNGVKYGRIPNLEKMEFGNHIDLDTFITPLYEGEIKHEKAFMFMAALYRPIIDEVESLYSIEPYSKEYIEKETWREFKKHCPADIYISSIGFFLNLRKESWRAFQHYLAVGLIQNQQGGNSQKVMDGMEALTTSQTETLQNMMKSPNNLLQLHYTNSTMMRTVEHCLN